MHCGARLRARWSMIAVDVRLGQTRRFDRTKDGEDRRQRHRSMRADGVQILWCGNMWHMPEGCMIRHAVRGLNQDGTI
jgi:hypothetical protein